VRIVDPGDTPRNQCETPSREMTKLERSDRPKTEEGPSSKAFLPAPSRKGPPHNHRDHILPRPKCQRVSVSLYPADSRRKAALDLL